MEYTIVPIEACKRGFCRIQGADLEQWALTDLDNKPDGSGWDSPPNVRTNAKGDYVGLVWRRPFSAARAVDSDETLPSIKIDAGWGV
jgi:hypothetical protein